MSDFDAIQKKLDSDEKFREEFLGDPVRVLEGENIVLSDEMKKSLEGFSQAARSGAVVPGSSLAAGSPGEAGIGISISISF